MLSETVLQHKYDSDRELKNIFVYCLSVNV